MGSELSVLLRYYLVPMKLQTLLKDCEFMVTVFLLPTRVYNLSQYFTQSSVRMA